MRSRNPRTAPRASPGNCWIRPPRRSRLNVDKWKVIPRHVSIARPDEPARSPFGRLGHCGLDDGWTHRSSCPASPGATRPTLRSHAAPAHRSRSHPAHLPRGSSIDQREPKHRPPRRSRPTSVSHATPLPQRAASDGRVRISRHSSGPVNLRTVPRSSAATRLVISNRRADESGRVVGGEHQ